MDVERVSIAAAVIAGAVATAVAVAWAGGQGGAQLAGLPVIAFCAVLAFGVQWLAFVPAYLQQTERFYDLVGSLTYIAVVSLALAASGSIDVRSAMLGLVVLVWAGRLGSFLFRRVRAEGGDARFDDIKRSASRFLIAWTLQGLWVFLTLSAALAAITARSPAPFGVADVVGVVIWSGGFALEVMADRQKRRFRVENPGRFVDTGLWAWSRHPNYFGEIVLWVGVFLIAASTLEGWQWVTIVSPVFVIVLLTRVSGIPILEERADERWGDDDDYRRYKARTPVLIPRPPRDELAA